MRKPVAAKRLRSSSRVTGVSQEAASYSTMKTGICRSVFVWYSAYGG
ncbi:hypothetical protein MCHLDSM_06714 [Mycolicibacterium chlorophenolicum]|uniref:Uncharacterized protein n=1 Tax=Mycolicibacterium chlorophenolicum TaxID=37916 RepID=A0A0J6V9A7_9MYCO|nr:hypothetical protein MCHLDSM_06714 [Mycolicibacterium chlorophenolicum]